MPTADSKKRSRSRSASVGVDTSDDQPQLKRQNTGGPPDSPTAQTASSSQTASPTLNGDSSSNSLESSRIPSKPAAYPASKTDQTPTGAMISLRCLIVTQDASIIIGKGGTHVNEIREMSGARVGVSEALRGNPERVLTVSGPLDAVAKAFGLIVRRINDEPFDMPSVPGSRAVTVKFMIPNTRMGSVIGKGGTKIKELQELSGARLNASDTVLPGSTERLLNVAGVADAVHIAAYHIGTILLEAQTRQKDVPQGTQAAYRPPPPPQPVRAAQSPPHYQTYPQHHHSGYNQQSAYHQYTYGPFPPMHQPHLYHAPPTPQHHPASFPILPTQLQPQQQPGVTQTQEIFIPNDLVGAIIGKGGSKINEIRQVSVTQIKIMEPGATSAGGGGGPNDRLVTVTGAPANIQMAVSLLYQRLDAEKKKQASLRA